MLKLFIPEIKELLAQKNWLELRELLLEIPEPDISDLVQELDDSQRIVILRLLPKNMLAEVFTHLDAKVKQDVLKAITEDETRAILAEMPPDDRTEFLEELPGQAIQKMVTLLSAEDRKEALQLLGYPEESVGRLMTPDYVAIRPEWTVEEALAHVRQKGMDSETTNVIYVTDKWWRLIGVLGLRRLILAKPGDKVEDIMDTAVISVSAFDDREKAVQLIKRYDVVALPVLDASGILLGIITIDDLFDVAEEEVTEDFQKSAAINPLKTSYRESSAFSLYANRVIWLAALLFISVITTGIISSHTDILNSAIALAFFIPLLIGTGGNTGNQSATLMIRALATGDIREGQWIWAFLREIGIGVLLGATMGVASWLLGLYKGGYQIALIVSISMVAIVMISSLIGIVLPLILQKLRIDPAVASNPLIASVMDILGLLTYFFVASIILRSL
ncbi:MAG TPA: magnesium transporter [Smithellaceae bacterium]|nr:magnesium transporter [Smithellaceae bacterium]HRS88764.1 magnesium transporter [Smithellaceae bacterium]HRV26505.1 magnesium transporter [Smithellaceae bacterium]